MRTLMLPALLTITTFVATASVEAQGQASTRRPTSGVGCEQAIRTASGTPSSARAVMEHLSLCGKDGAVMTTKVLAATRSELDTVALYRVYGAVDQWRDGEVMGTVIALAQDGAASTPARVFAVRHLIGLLAPGAYFTYGNLAGGERRETRAGHVLIYPECQLDGHSSGVPDAIATPLPTGSKAQIHALLSRLSGDVSAPAALRNAAKCAEYV